jgi:RNA polymerase sigma factor (sigma-70 family)
MPIDPVEYMDWAEIVARRWRKRGIEDDDLFGEAYLGLVIAARKYRPDRGCRFEKVAECWINGRISQAIRCNTIPPGPHAWPPESGPLDEESWMRTLRTLSRLKPIESQVLQVRLGLEGGEELSLAETARFLGLKKAAVDWLYRSGLKKLRLAVVRAT